MIFTLDAEKRTMGKKSELSALRASGLIPAVLYGAETESTPISVNKNEFTKYFKKSFTELAFWEIILEGKTYHTILKDKLVHPVRRDVMHIDFMVVGAKAEMEFDIPIHFDGEAIGTREGGFVDMIQRTVKLSCIASNLPGELRLDITDLKVGESKHVRDLPMGKWTYKDHADNTLVVIHPKRTEAPTTATAVEKPEAPEAK
ncbi:MAG: 50S ribosomal protein L25 [Candidatus Cloacimonadaceae bacterium]|nr:50S ribosomal protein L25 [Candidatus Cloacimonadaceae bacterium]MDP3114120.1 50S ribosomal protein L25 [Candidatus Cloacimonadaceae bacterium]